jgi:hypothetical protein
MQKKKAEVCKKFVYLHTICRSVHNFSPFLIEDAASIYCVDSAMRMSEFSNFLRRFQSEEKHFRLWYRLNINLPACFLSTEEYLKKTF